MTFKNIEDITALLKQATPDWVDKAREYHRELKALVYGEDYTDLLLRIEHIESDKRAKARKNYSRSIQDLNERLLRPIDNVYSATGGTKNYQSIPEAQRKNVLKAVTHIRDNKSLEKFLQTFWAKDLYIVDPAGVLFLEYAEGVPPYPVYKSIDCIRNYYAEGQNLEWIVFEPKRVKIAGEDKELIRFVDDRTDYTFIKDGDTFRLVEEKTFQHPFGRVPGLVNSDITRLGKPKRFSLLDNVLGIEREFMRDQSVLTIYKFLNGFATPIRPVMVCPSCRGIGKRGTDDCPDCDGKGHVMRKDVTDEVLLPISLDKEKGYSLPPGIFSYMTPPLDIWNQYTEEEKRLESRASDTLWGTHKEKFENERTAFETFVDAQPVMSKLSEISEVAEFMEWQFTEWLVNYFVPTKKKEEPATVISYGKMFIIEPAEAIMEKYRVNKEKGVSVVILDRQMLEYITSKYKNNPKALRNELIKKELDYYVHYTIDEVNSIFGAREAQKKMLFTDWWETLNSQDLDGQTVETLKTRRDTWIDSQLVLINNINTNE